MRPVPLMLRAKNRFIVVAPDAFNYNKIVMSAKAILPALFVFLAGFIITALEVIGARYLAKDFGGSFYVWISQIGVILAALALGYAVGGALADRWRRAGFLAALLAAAGLVICLIPNFAPPLLEAIVLRHPAGQDIPPLWLKLDPALGSAVVFFLPCFVLAIISPYTIRRAARRLEEIGTTSGIVYAAGSLGSIAGVFVSGYFFIDYFSMTTIFRALGALALLLAILGLAMDKLESP